MAELGGLPDDPVLIRSEAQHWRDWIKGEYVLRLSQWTDIRAQLPLLYEAVLRYERPAVAELGTRYGNSTSALLHGAAGTGGHVWSVDPGQVAVPAWWEQSGYWSFLAAGDMSDEAAAFVPPVLDVLFIDTSHLYEHTLAELNRYGPRVRPGGTILCHDADLRRDNEIMRDPDLGDWWLEAAADGPEFPVGAALDVWCAENGLSWECQQPPEVRVPGEPFYALGTVRIPAEGSIR